MAKKEKEEDRIERIIRGLLRLPENRRCINCNSLGPQYVCTTFLTFVCTNCSGVHREFTHRVKSVSMAKFSAEEVASLQAGGNERARQIYFKDWDPQRNSYPDGSDLHRLRAFIKHVYVDRRFSGDRSCARVSRTTLGEREQSYDSSKVGPYRDGSKTPNYDDRFQKVERSHPRGRSEERIVKYFYDERRSPRYSQEISRSGGWKRSPVRFEIVDDRVRSGRESSFGSLSSNSQKTVDQSSYPAVRSIKDILGENIPSLQVGDVSKTKDGKDAVSSSQNQIIASSSGKESNSVQAVEDKTPQSLIDLDTDSMPLDAEAPPKTQQNHQKGGNCNSNESSGKQDAPPGPKPNTLEFLLFELSVPSVEPSGSVSNITNNDNPPSTTAGSHMLLTETPPGQFLNLPENAGVSTSLPGGNVPANDTPPTVPLSQMLTLPAPGSSMGQMLALPNSFDASAIVSGGNMAIGIGTSAASEGKISTPSSNADVTGDSLLTGGMPIASAVDQNLLDAATSLALSGPAQPSNENASQTVIDIDNDSTYKFPNGQPVSINRLSAFPAAVDTSSGLQTNTTKNKALYNQNLQPWASQNVPNPQESASASGELPSQVLTIFQGSDSGIKTQQLPVETKSSERKELPMDLFASSYSPVSGSTPGWQNALPYGSGFNLQYHPNAEPVRPYPYQKTSSNPFDLNSESSSIQVSLFPSIGNMQTALPDISAPGPFLPTSTIATNASGLTSTQTPYKNASAIPLHTSSFALETPADMYVGEQLQMNTQPSRGIAQGAGVGFGSDAYSGSLQVAQQWPRGYQLPSPPNSFPSPGGNPFG